MVNARANDKENYKLTRFSPRYFNRFGVRVTYKGFIKEHDYLMKPYLERDKKKRGKKN